MPSFVVAGRRRNPQTGRRPADATNAR